MGKCPYTKIPGYVANKLIHTGGWLVIINRTKAGDYSGDARKNPWLVKHMESGKTKAYRTKDEANSAAHRSAVSIVPSYLWWLESD